MKDPGDELEVDSLSVLLISVSIVVLFLFFVMFGSSAGSFYIWPISCVYCFSCVFVPIFHLLRERLTIPEKYFLEGRDR